MTAAFKIGALLLAVVLAKAVSTDGEATAYLSGTYAGSFDLQYAVHVTPQPRNTSWTFVGLELLGFERGDASVGIGLGNGKPYVSTTDSLGRSWYHEFDIACNEQCLIELRGTAASILALVNGREVAAWTRTEMPMRRPYVQINGEVTAVGDRLDASLTPLQMVAAGNALKPPRCGFTTQGVGLSLQGSTLHFRGQRRMHADVAYIDLRNGHLVRECPRR